MGLFEPEDGEISLHNKARPRPITPCIAIGDVPMLQISNEMDAIQGAAALPTIVGPPAGPTSPPAESTMASLTIPHPETVNRGVSTTRGEADILDLVSRGTRLEIRRERKKVCIVAHNSIYADHHDRYEMRC